MKTIEKIKRNTIKLPPNSLHTEIFELARLVAIEELNDVLTAMANKQIVIRDPQAQNHYSALFITYEELHNAIQERLEEIGEPENGLT